MQIYLILGISCPPQVNEKMSVLVWIKMFGWLGDTQDYKEKEDVIAGDKDKAAVPYVGHKKCLHALADVHIYAVLWPWPSNRFKYSLFVCGVGQDWGFLRPHPPRPVCCRTLMPSLV